MMTLLWVWWKWDFTFSRVKEETTLWSRSRNKLCRKQASLAQLVNRLPFSKKSNVSHQGTSQLQIKIETSITESFRCVSAEVATTSKCFTPSSNFTERPSITRFRRRQCSVSSCCLTKTVDRCSSWSVWIHPSNRVKLATISWFFCSTKTKRLHSSCNWPSKLPKLPK